MACCSGCIYVAILFAYDVIVKKQRYVISTLFFLGLMYTAFLFAMTIVACLHNKVVFTDDKLIVTGTILSKRQTGGIQFPDEVEYNDIQSVAIICVNANSKKKSIKTADVYSSLRPFVFYEITLKNGDTKWIYIECFSRRQRKRMLDTINQKTGLTLVYKDLERRDISIYKRNKEKYDKSKKSNKETASDKPSWINENMISSSKTAQQNAKDILDWKYGPGKWKIGPGSEFSKIVKWIEKYLSNYRD